MLRCIKPSTASPIRVENRGNGSLFLSCPAYDCTLRQCAKLGIVNTSLLPTLMFSNSSFVTLSLIIFTSFMLFFCFTFCFFLACFACSRENILIFALLNHSSGAPLCAFGHSFAPTTCLLACVSGAKINKEINPTDTKVCKSRVI